MVDDRVVAYVGDDDEDAAVDAAVDEFVADTFGPGVVVERVEVEVPEQLVPPVVEETTPVAHVAKRVVRGGTAQNRRRITEE